METTLVLGLCLSLLVGVSLGLIGSGGSILTVPILVYVVGVSPVLATAYSLFIVGSTAVVGSLKNISSKNVNFRIVFLFGLFSLAAIFITRAKLLPLLPEKILLSQNFFITKSKLIMLLFSLVMFWASLRMIFKKKDIYQQEQNSQKISALPLVLQGIIIGVLAGLVGAGGGFLIIPALVFLAKLPMKKAIGTSLTIVAIQSLVGFWGDVLHQQMNWLLLLSFSGISVVGLFLGIYLSKKMNDSKLQKIFGWFVFLMAFWILFKEIITLN